MAEDEVARIDETVEAVRDALSKLGVMANRIVVLVEGVGKSGEVELWVGVDDEATSWQVLGLLEHARTLEHAGIHELWRRDHP